jgi:type VI secretion system protein ImpH
MAGPIRKEDFAVTLAETGKQLFAEPHGFDFFQAVRLLELLLPEREPVGEFANPRKESVRFSVLPSLAFPASAIQSLEKGEDGAAAKMSVNFMGLVGPLGVLPSHYSEFATGRMRARDHTFVDFLNIFQHRTISLFYRAWKKCHFTVGYEREGTDPITDRLLDFIGLGLPSLQSRQKVRDESLLFYGGLLGLAPRSALALESILCDYFDVPVSVEQFVGAWRPLIEDDQCCMDAGNLESTQLGLGAVAGDEIWDCQSRARILLGPLTAKRYRDFLPNGECFEPLHAITHFFSGNNVEFEVELILKREEVPVCELGDDPGFAQLGWFTWIKSKPIFERDPCDTVLLFAGQ